MDVCSCVVEWWMIEGHRDEYGDVTARRGTSRGVGSGLGGVKDKDKDAHVEDGCLVLNDDRDRCIGASERRTLKRFLGYVHTASDQCQWKRLIVHVLVAGCVRNIAERVAYTVKLIYEVGAIHPTNDTTAIILRIRINTNKCPEYYRDLREIYLRATQTTKNSL